MQNMFTGEHQARIVIETRHAEARRHDALKLANAGHAGMETVTTIGATIERLLAATRRSRPTIAEPSRQPCMAC